MEGDYTLNKLISLSKEELKLVCLCMIGLTEKDIAGFMQMNLNTLKRKKIVLRAKFDALTSQEMCYAALHQGFGLDSTFNGAQVFSENEKQKLRQLAPKAQFTTHTL